MLCAIKLHFTSDGKYTSLINYYGDVSCLVDDINQKSRISMSHVHKDEASVLPEGKRIEVVIAMPFLDVNPLAANQ